MLNNSYYKNTLEAVTQGSEVGGYPSKILSLLKTTLFITLVSLNNSFGEDIVAEINIMVDKFNGESPIKMPLILQNKGYEGAEEAEIRIEKQRNESYDVYLNKAEIADGRYYINKQWVSTKYTKPNTTEDLKDSDNDGYDDYFEFKNGTNPKDSSSFPAVRNGNNKIIFK
jgi:hypothetical protein